MWITTHTHGIKIKYNPFFYLSKARKDIYHFLLLFLYVCSFGCGLLLFFFNLFLVIFVCLYIPLDFSIICTLGLSFFSFSTFIVRIPNGVRRKKNIWNPFSWSSVHRVLTLAIDMHPDVFSSDLLIFLVFIHTSNWVVINFFVHRST